MLSLEQAWNREWLLNLNNQLNQEKRLILKHRLN
jgi:hypothetical protein